MYAAVVTSFDVAPSYQEFPTPTPQGSDEVLVDVVAAGLHRRVRSQADGSHYTSTGELPLVPGVDGVARFPDGTLRYFALGDTTMGAMAEQTVVDLRRSVVLPAGADPVLLAAAMNPAMSSWVALRRRTGFQAGQSVLVLGATGSSGKMAVQVAKQLGAARVVAAGRNPERLAGLPELGADAVVSLGDGANAAAAAAADVDVVIDYLWGPATADAMIAIATHRSNDRQPLTWIEIGAVAGATAQIPAAALRALPLQIVGSGQGSVSTRDILAELPAIAEAITSGAPAHRRPGVPLRDVTSAWQDIDGTERIVPIKLGGNSESRCRPTWLRPSVPTSDEPRQPSPRHARRLPQLLSWPRRAGLGLSLLRAGSSLRRNSWFTTIPMISLALPLTSSTTPLMAASGPLLTVAPFRSGMGMSGLPAVDPDRNVTFNPRGCGLVISPAHSN